MSAETKKVPHYSQSVERLNSVGGISLGHFRHGVRGDGTTVPTEALEHIPHGGVVFFEGLATDLPLPDAGSTRSDLLLTAIEQTSEARGTIVLPGGHSADEIGKLLGADNDLTDDQFRKQYERLQHRREMQAVMGSLAWFLAFTNNRAGDDAVLSRPVAFWGRHHGSSLAEMYEYVGVTPVDTRDYGPSDNQLLIGPHPIWPEEQLQAEFMNKLAIARSHRW